MPLAAFCLSFYELGNRGSSGFLEVVFLVESLNRPCVLRGAFPGRQDPRSCMQRLKDHEATRDYEVSTSTINPT